jgi:hypothetical protein
MRARTVSVAPGPNGQLAVSGTTAAMIASWRETLLVWFGSIASIPLDPPVVCIAADSSPHLILMPADMITRERDAKCQQQT